MNLFLYKETVMLFLRLLISSESQKKKKIKLIIYYFVELPECFLYLQQVISSHTTPHPSSPDVTLLNFSA